MKRLMALVLACVLCLCCLAGCGSTAEETAATPAPTPTPNPDLPQAPQMIVIPPRGGETPEKKDVTVVIHGEENVIPMTAVSGSFAAFGGPDFRLLVETERYQVNDVDGFCYITLQTGMSGDVYAELGFRPGEAADDIGIRVLDDYGSMSVTKSLGTEQLGAHRVRHVRGETIQNVFDAYLLDTEGGCLTMVLSTTSETEAHRARLTASLETLEIFQ